MPQQVDRGPQSYRRVALIATGLAVGLISLGGVVRITGSGMGCGDHWPLCNGRLVPNLSDSLEVIEWSHRWVAAMLSATVLCLALIAWRKHRGDGFLRAPAFGALGLLLVQVLLGALTVKLGTAAPAVVIHLTTAMLFLSLLVVCTLRAGERLRGGDGTFVPGRGPNAALFATGFALVVILFGGFVANYDAGLQCLGFPLCGGALTLPKLPLARLQWVHRVLAFLFVGHCFGVAMGARRYTGDGGAAFRRAAWWLFGLGALQILVGAIMILQLLPTALRAGHLFVGSLVWVAGVVLSFRSRRVEAVRRLGGSTIRIDDPAARRLGDSAAREKVSALSQEFTQDPGRPVAESPSRRAAEPPALPVGPSARRTVASLAADLITLTKPRIISLLLLTTVLPMFITDRGLPPPSLVLWVVLGGYLMAGGANTVNMWFDRDIDMLMARTKLRPIPAGRIPAWAALLFGLAQGAVAFWVFWRFVNPLSAWLAFSGYLFYVFIYTAWLKRLTSQNIVIGGAAGAFPPLVGWTAMTGTLDLPAIYLFAIIFFWTPPHFWALALIKRQDYAKAGIPMMPVVQGERWTKVQMLAYSLMLIPLTLMPTVFGALGLFYAAAAIALGGRLLWYSVKVLRESGVTPTAWKMYKYSLLYLALLFVAMGVDRAMPFGHKFERAPVLILDKPEQDALGAVAGHEGH